MVERLAGGVRAAQLRGDADLEAAADAIVGSLLYRVLAGRPMTENRGAAGLLDILFTGLRP